MTANDDQAPDASDSNLENTESLSPVTGEDWASLLEHLRSVRGFDFHGYKPTSLTRRIRKRMMTLGFDSFAAYQDYLEVHQDEFQVLFDTILINVTSFFRDPEAWEVVQATV